jgi:hypothetical protein
MGLFSKKKEETIEDLQRRMFDDESLSQQFYTRLFSGDVFVAGDTGSNVGGDQTSTAGSKLKILSLMGPDNHPFIPVFTSMEEMAKFVPEGTNCLKLNGYAVFTMMRGSVMVLNPANEYALRLDPAYIGQVLDFFASNQN